MPIPIPKGPSGYTKGAASALLQIEALIDIQCPFSKKSWPTLLAVSDRCGPEEVQLRVQMMPLASHRQSWDVTRAISPSRALTPQCFSRLQHFFTNVRSSFSTARSRNVPRLIYTI